MANATPSPSAAKLGGEREPTAARAASAASAKTRFRLKVMFLPAARNDAWLSVRFIRCQPSLFRAFGASIKGRGVCNMGRKGGRVEGWIDGVLEWWRR